MSYWEKMGKSFLGLEEHRTTVKKYKEGAWAWSVGSRESDLDIQVGEESELDQTGRGWCLH